jgi:hypothetical protein
MGFAKTLATEKSHEWVSPKHSHYGQNTRNRKKPRMGFAKTLALLPKHSQRGKATNGFRLNTRAKHPIGNFKTLTTLTPCRFVHNKSVLFHFDLKKKTLPNVTVDLYSLSRFNMTTIHSAYKKGDHKKIIPQFRNGQILTQEKKF